MKTDWGQLTRLTKDLNWGNADLMSGIFMYAVDTWSEFTKHKIFITPNGGTSGKHEPHSLHYSGCAIDFVVPGSSHSDILDIFLSLTRFPFTEIGVYPQWHYFEKKIGGFHIGMDTKMSLGTMRRKLWLGVKDKTQNNIYIGLNSQNLKYYGVI